MRLIRLVLFIIVFPSFCHAEDSYLDVVYRRGARLWSQGQFQRAVNQWFQYLELAGRLESESAHKKIMEVKTLYEQGREKLRDPSPVPVDPVPSPLQKGVLPKPVLSKISGRPAKSSKDPALAKRLMEKAEKAEYSGHFEESRRLVRLALQCDPANASLRKKLEELDQMLK